MRKKVVIALLVIVVLFLGVVAVQPSEFRVERSITIAAPAAKIFPHVNDFRAWKTWSPWEKMDLTMTKTYEGPPEGVGTIYKWSGNDEVGQGVMTQTENVPNERIRIKLEFLKPFAAVNTAEFNFQPEGDRTKVTWSMFGPCNFLGKFMHLFIGFDNMVGTPFAKGLADLKTVVEAEPAKQSEENAAEEAEKK